MTYNDWLCNEITRLKDEKTILNHKLETQLRNNTKIKIERDDMMLNLRKLHRTKWDLEDEHKKLKQRISKLVSENTTLQNDLFSEQLLQDETDDYIDILKNQLFNAYLEIESDNVNIQLSHYHIKKLLKIIDEHTLINPYTN